MLTHEVVDGEFLGGEAADTVDLEEAVQFVGYYYYVFVAVFSDDVGFERAVCVFFEASDDVGVFGADGFNGFEEFGDFLLKNGTIDVHAVVYHQGVGVFDGLILAFQLGDQFLC